MSSQDRESVRVLQECMELQRRKSRDYQNDKSNVKQAMHYRRGVSTIHDMIAQKLLRAQSLLEAYENGDTSEPNFEGLEDTYKDLINYASFAVSYMRGKMEGQECGRNMLNRQLHDGDAQMEIIEEYYTPLKDAKAVAYNEDTSGGSSSGQAVNMFEDLGPLEEGERIVQEAEKFFDDREIEEDGFITVVPTLFAGGRSGYDNQRIRKKPSKNASAEERIKSAYFRDVAPKGEVRTPLGEVNCTDPLQHTYINKVVKDAGDRHEEDIREHFERIECREQESKRSGTISRSNSRKKTS